MGLFEQNPWLLIPFVVAIVETWAALKSVVKRWIGHGRTEFLGISRRCSSHQRQWQPNAAGQAPCGVGGRYE